MTRLIDPDKLRAELTDRHLSTGRLVQWEAAMDAATVEVEPVRHGRDIWRAQDHHCEFKCSLCKEEIRELWSDRDIEYCPFCGTKMDGDPECGKEACDISADRVT